MKKKRRRRPYTRKRRIWELRFKIASLCILILGGIFGLIFRKQIIMLWEKDTIEETSTDALNEPEKEEGWKYPWETGEEDNSAPGPGINVKQLHLSETQVYSFMQGPVAWNGKSDWSGSWCEETMSGNRFSVFGCGLCDLANVYSTLTSYECSPIDMYYYAKEASSYSPSPGYGAIDWPEMVQTLDSLGFICEIRDKDETYEEFCESLEGALGAIALVSSYVDNTFWEDTEGHYVNLWMFNPENEMVFLGDSGSPARNRSWIPLRTVYNALKTFGNHQYMLIHSYNESANTWKYSGIHEDWAPPDYYHVKENAD